MKYMLLIYGNDEIWGSVSPDEFAEIIRDTDAFNAKYLATGELLSAHGLAADTDAKTVRVRDGVPAVTDGPYLEAKEYLGSISILDVDSLERALELAAENPAARYNGIELRPLMHEAGTEM